MAQHYAEIVRVLRFWFEEAGAQRWFAASEEFDALCRDRLLDCHERAAAGEFQAWGEAPEGSLALCILLDQAPRNMFRGTPRMFATDAAALTVARNAVEREFDAGMNEDQRAFLYLPFEHAEDMEDQRTALRLFAGRTTSPVYLDFAAKHLVIVSRFGRFPHRNAVLGRETTAEEAQFLKLPDSGF